MGPRRPPLRTWGGAPSIIPRQPVGRPRGPAQGQRASGHHPSPPPALSQEENAEQRFCSQPPGPARKKVMKSAGGLGSAVLGAQGMQWAWVSGDEGQAELARSPPLRKHPSPGGGVPMVALGVRSLGSLSSGPEAPQNPPVRSDVPQGSNGSRSTALSTAPTPVGIHQLQAVA